MSYYRNRRDGYNRYNRRGRSRRGGFNRYGNTQVNRYTNKNFSYGQVLDKVTRDVTRLMGVVNTEFKKVDTQSEIAITDAPQIRLINALQKGDNFNNRDGRSVRFKSIQLKWTVFMNPLNVRTAVRCMIVQDKQPNGTLMLIGDLLDETHTNSFKNLSNRKRFIILKDETITQTGRVLFTYRGTRR